MMENITICIYVLKRLCCANFLSSYFYLGVLVGKDLHTLIFKNHIIFLTRCTAAASLLHCVLNTLF